MCGVFGFVGRGGGPDLRVLARVAETTERRGPHAFGFAWIDSKGRLKCYKQTGRITDHLGLLAMAAGARMLVGHCRWATQGDPAENINNHPHPSDGGWVVHNGQLRDYDGLVGSLGLHPVSACDSEVLGLLIEQGEGAVLDRCLSAVRAVSGTDEERGTLFSYRPALVLLGLWPRPDRLVAVRQGNPLHWCRAERGYYLASLPDGLPGKAAALPDGTACLFTTRGVRHAEV